MKNQIAIQPEMRYFCPHCEFRNRIFLKEGETVSCQYCGNPVLKDIKMPDFKNPKFKCLLCGDDQYYLIKDFNKGIGLLIFVIGAILSIWTYGISLAVAAVIDAILYKRLPFLKVCYICDSEYKSVPIDPSDKSYDHVIGDLIRPIKEDWHISKKKNFSSAS